MLQSNFGLFGSSGNSWDSSCAREFLKIPEDQLNMIDAIPEWSSSNGTICAVSEVIPTTVEKQLNPVDVDTNLNQPSSSKELGNNLQSQSFPGEKSLRKSTSLCSLNEIDKSTNCSHPKPSNSVPDIREAQDINMSNLLSTTRMHAVNEKRLLDKTYIVPAVLGDATNICETLSGKDTDCVKEPIRKIFDKLSNTIVNHKLMKSTTDESCAVSTPHDQIFQSKEIPHDVLLNKKLQLLEKRMSPAKYCTSQPLEVHSSEGFMSSSASPFHLQLTEKLKRAVDSDIGSIKATMSETSEKQVNPSPVVPHDGTTKNKEAQDKFLSNVSLSAEGQSQVRVAVKNKPVGFEDESFVSQTIPCGQPLPSQVDSNKTGTLNSAQTGVPILEKIQFDSQSHSSLFDNSNKMDNLIPSQHTVPVSEKPRSCSVAPNTAVAGCSKEVDGQELSSLKSGSKRKRKSKGDKASKKFHDEKNSKKINIKFTDMQVKNMISLMKIFQSAA